MFIVITGLDGTGTSSIAEGLHNIDKNSILVRTPSYLLFLCQTKYKNHLIIKIIMFIA